jgi:very-short-patch-repair endonuclease
MEQYFSSIDGRLHIRDAARQLRNNMTASEVRLWSFLRGKRCGDMKFRRQAPIGAFIVDFYCPAYRLVIEVDGSIHQEEEVLAYDNRREESLREAGMTILRISNEEAFRISGNQLYAKICQALQKEEGNHEEEDKPKHHLVSSNAPTKHLAQPTPPSTAIPMASLWGEEGGYPREAKGGGEGGS